MQSPPEQHEHVHSEVVHLKDLGLGEEENKDTQQLGEGDPAHHRRSHVRQSRVSSLHARVFTARAEPAYNVRAELHSYTNRLHNTRN